MFLFVCECMCAMCVLMQTPVCLWKAEAHLEEPYLSLYQIPRYQTQGLRHIGKHLLTEPSRWLANKIYPKNFFKKIQAKELLLKDVHWGIIYKLEWTQVRPPKCPAVKDWVIDCLSMH